MPTTILLLRREKDSLTKEERKALAKAFPGSRIKFITIDPADYLAHNSLCELLEPAAVLLPRERPIPSLAMEKGIPHISVIGGECKELMPLTPEWKLFEPRRRKKRAAAAAPSLEGSPKIPFHKNDQY